MGTLAGRYKRLWQQSGIEKFYSLSEELYADSYNLSGNDLDQLYYHAINLSYLKIAKGKGGTAAQENAKPWAIKALNHAMDAVETYWQQVTIAEALLILGHFNEACAEYSNALKFSPQPREIESTFMQAMDIARHRYPSMKNTENLLASYFKAEV